MSRHFDQSPLPTHRSTLKGFQVLSSEQNKPRRIIEILRGVINELRQGKDAPFYSVLEIDAFLQAHLRTIAIAFLQLEAEGLLLRIRGTHTKLLPFETATLRP